MGLTMGTGPFGKRPRARSTSSPTRRRITRSTSSLRRAGCAESSAARPSSTRRMWPCCTRRATSRSGTSRAPTSASTCSRRPITRRTARSRATPSYWTIRAGGKLAENKVWGYPEILPGTPDITDRVAFYWDAVDHWYEEDEEVFVHPRDPYHRVDIVPSSRTRQGVARRRRRWPSRAGRWRSSRPNLPTRWYLPKEDIVPAYEATARSTACPYKGTASYWSVGGNENIAWSYEEPDRGRGGAARPRRLLRRGRRRRHRRRAPGARLLALRQGREHA